MRHRTPTCRLSTSLLLTLVSVAASILLSCGRSADEIDAVGAAAGTDADAHLVATFLAPDLDGTGTKALVAALAANPGVLTAAALPDSGLFVVAFTGAKTSPAEVLGTVTKTNPRLVLRNVANVAGGTGADACAGCPSQAACGGTGGK